MREPNSHECLYFGRKLSNIITNIESSAASDIYIGSDKDDEIYFPPVLKEGEEMLKERVTLDISNGEFYDSLDLEDILRFAATNCKGIYARVLAESTK